MSNKPHMKPNHKRLAGASANAPIRVRWAEEPAQYLVSHMAVGKQTKKREFMRLTGNDQQG
jgi:hypothetical protein